MRRLFAGLALVAAALSFAAAPARHASAAHHGSPANGGKTWTITVTMLAYGPTPAGMRVGDTVVWVNKDIFLHSATANDHSFDVTIPVHGSGQLKLTKAGTFAYTCKYHPGMKSQLVVAK